MKRLTSTACCGLILWMAGFCFCFLTTSTAVGNEPLVREIVVQEPLLVLPIKNGAEMRWCEIWCDGRLEHRFQIEFAEDAKQADWWSYIDVSEYQGKTLSLQLRAPADSPMLQPVANTNEVPRKEPLYAEKLRPQFHFSQKQGWNNDPNGMVYLNGVYHLFWQSNPFGLNWGNMYWGHAISKDLIHWTELPLAMRPWGGITPISERQASFCKGQCFSGSANVAHDLPDSDPAKKNQLIATLTDTAVGEAMAISNDAGKTWRYCDSNPIIPHSGRDPKLVWMPEEKAWVIAVYDELDGKQKVAFYRSTDRKHWERTGDIDGFYECPELFRIQIEGTDEYRWILWAADAQYFVGQFNGKTFVPEHEQKHRLHYGTIYASQCFSNVPGGRVIQIGWNRMDLGREPGLLFNQGFTLPLELKLKQTSEGLRLFAQPAEEVASLRQEARELKPNSTLKLAEEKFGDGQLYDIVVTVEANADKPVVLRFGKQTFTFDPASETLQMGGVGLGQVPLRKVPLNGDSNATFRVLVDRFSLEVCGNGGEVYVTGAREDMGQLLDAISIEGPAKAEIWPMKSIWTY